MHMMNEITGYGDSCWTNCLLTQLYLFGQIHVPLPLYDNTLVSVYLTKMNYGLSQEYITKHTDISNIRYVLTIDTQPVHFAFKTDLTQASASPST
jgi:hypothetical protein